MGCSDAMSRLKAGTAYRIATRTMKFAVYGSSRSPWVVRGTDAPVGRGTGTTLRVLMSTGLFLFHVVV